MSEKLPLAARTFPSRIADLGFTVDLPTDWISHPLPDDEADFSNPMQFAALAVVTAPHAAIVFAFAARPAYDQGTLHDWAWYLLREGGFAPRAVGVGKLGSLPAIVGESTQESEMGPMVVRFAFAEDGSRLLNVTLSAPELLADAVRDAWPAALASFKLETPRGPTVALEPTAAAPGAAAATAAGAAATAGATPASAAPETFAAHALAEDAATLDPEHPINVNLRERGIGLTPNVRSKDDAGRRATVAAGALTAFLDVPYGWHVLDDGRRTLLLDPSGAVQIHLHLIPREGRDDDAILDAIEAEARTSYPEPQFVRLAEGRIRALGMRNIQDGDTPIEQYSMLIAGPEEAKVLRARVTTSPERAAQSCNLAQLILESFVFPGR